MYGDSDTGAAANYQGVDTDISSYLANAGNDPGKINQLG